MADRRQRRSRSAGSRRRRWRVRVLKREWPGLEPLGMHFAGMGTDLDDGVSVTSVTAPRVLSPSERNTMRSRTRSRLLAGSVVAAVVGVSAAFVALSPSAGAG